MLSRRNFVMMMTMIGVVLTLFLSSAVLKEYWNDYHVNHMAEETPLLPRAEQTPAADALRVVYIGGEENGYLRVMEEWAGYRKYAFHAFSSLERASHLLSAPQKNACLLIDGQLLQPQAESTATLLSNYVEKGGVVVFYRLPSYRTIEESVPLQTLLGIQKLRGESVRLAEIRLFSGFLLGGETHYVFDDASDPALADMERDIPWYDISSRTKTYMAGFLTEEEKSAMGLTNEDFPAILWRSNLGAGSVFAVNGSYLQGEAALGLLDAMVYEANDYALYAVVNAQNLCFAGFPSLTVENEARMQQVYGMTTQQFCRDILWPSFVSSAEKGNWKITSFLSLKQKGTSPNEPKQSDLIEYLKFFNEQSAEAGITLGRMEDTGVSSSVKEENAILEDWGITYQFTGGYVRAENKPYLSALTDRQGRMRYFSDMRTVVGAYEPDQPILSWLTDEITLQAATADAYTYSFMDSLRLKSLETALGYSNVQADVYRTLWPESPEDQWENLAEKLSSHIDTYWKPFAAFDKTTISQSDGRVRNFLNGRVESWRSGDTLSIRTAAFEKDAYLLLRTHGEQIDSMTGGTWKRVEEDTYLLHLTEGEAAVALRPKSALFYQD